jgi:hypothetical protein
MALSELLMKHAIPRFAEAVAGKRCAHAVCLLTLLINEGVEQCYRCPFHTAICLADT